MEKNKHNSYKHFLKYHKTVGAPVPVQNVSSAQKEIYFYNLSSESTKVTSPGPTGELELDANFLSMVKTAKLNTAGSFDVRRSIKWLNEKEQVLSYGVMKSLREAILFNEDNHIPFTVWERLTDELKEENIYLFQTLTPKNYYELKLTTTKSTTISTEDGSVTFTLSDDVIRIYTETDKELRNRSHPKLCCPELAAVTLNLFPGCSSKNCLKPVVIVQCELALTYLQSTA